MQPAASHRWRERAFVILESIVTSVDRSGRINLAPMGPRIEGDLTSDNEVAFVLRPFSSSRTYHNLLETRVAVVHVTDDAQLIAKSAVDTLQTAEIARLVQQIGDSQWWRLRDCHRWFALEVESISSEEPRVDIRCRVVQSGVVRPFFGFNRARHAIIEAAILATRTHLLPPEEILEQIDRLQPLIDKTGGPDEIRAFEFLKKTIDERIASR